MRRPGCPPAGPSAGEAASGEAAAGQRQDRLELGVGGGAGGTCRGWVPSWPSALSTGARSTGGSAQLRNSTPWTVWDPRCWKRCCHSCGCPEMGRPSPWQRFVDSAVRADAPVPAQAPAGPPAGVPAGPEVHSAGVRGIVPRTAGGLRALLVARLLPALRTDRRQRQAPEQAACRNRGQATAPDRPAPGPSRPSRLGGCRRRRVAAAAGAGRGDRRPALGSAAALLVVIRRRRRTGGGGTRGTELPDHTLHCTGAGGCRRVPLRSSRVAEARRCRGRSGLFPFRRRGRGGDRGTAAPAQVSRPCRRGPLGGSCHRVDSHRQG